MKYEAKRLRSTAKYSKKAYIFSYIGFFVYRYFRTGQND